MDLVMWYLRWFVLPSSVNYFALILQQLLGFWKTNILLIQKDKIDFGLMDSPETWREWTGWISPGLFFFALLFSLLSHVLYLLVFSSTRSRRESESVHIWYEVNAAIPWLFGAPHCHVTSGFANGLYHDLLLQFQGRGDLRTSLPWPITVHRNGGKSMAT